MNHGLLVMVRILDMLNEMPDDKHLMIITNSIDEDDKNVFMKCISYSIHKSNSYFLYCKSKKGSNIIHVYKYKSEPFKEEWFNNLHIELDYTYILDHPFKLGINRLEYEDKDRYDQNIK